MADKLFREESMEELRTPSDLNQYIRIIIPGAWVVFIAIVCFIIGLLTWLNYDSLKTTVSSVTLVKDGKTETYIDSSLRDDLEDDTDKKLELKMEYKTYNIVGIDDNPIMVDETFSDYLVDAGNFTRGQWVYVIHTDDIPDISNGAYRTEIIIDSYTPMQYLLRSVSNGNK